MPSGIEGDTSDIVEFSERLKNCAITIDILKYLNGVVTDTHVRLMFEVIVKRKDGMPLEKEYTTVAVDVPLEAIEILPNIPDVRWVETATNRKDWLNVWDKVDKQGMTDTFISEIENLLKREGDDKDE